MANNAVAQMQIKKKQLEMERTALQVEAKGVCRSISSILVPEVTEIEDMEIAKAAGYMDDLVMKQAELLAIQQKIWQLEAALGN